MKHKFNTRIIICILGVSALTGCVTSPELVNGIKDVTYTTVTESFDWGPGITKVIIDFEGKLEPSSVSASQFSVSSVRNFKDFDFSTFSQKEEATDHEVQREILSAYVSDQYGNKIKSGTYVTIEMKVDPTLSEGSPFNYNFLSGFNSFVKTSYKISITDSILYKDGTPVSIAITGFNEYTRNINKIADNFNNNVKFTYGKINLGYASFKPENAKSGKTPLIIWLHGAGEGGIDTYITIMGNKVVNLATDNIQQYFGETGALILAPQSPTMWMDADGTKKYNNSVQGNMGTSYYTEALKALIDDYIVKTPEVDTSRIYIGGCSNGGYMTINMLMNYPEMFAAAYPAATPYMSSWITAEKIKAIKDIPIWFTHAKTDATVQIMAGSSDPQNYLKFNLEYDEDGNTIPLNEHVNSLYTALTNAGASNVHYTLYNKVEDTSGKYFQEDGITPYEYAGHWSWIYTLNNDPEDTIDGNVVNLFQWLSHQSK